MADGFLPVIGLENLISWNGPVAGTYLATSSPALALRETKVRANSKSTMHSSLCTICSFSSNWDSQIEPAAPTSLTARVDASHTHSRNRRESATQQPGWTPTTRPYMRFGQSLRRQRSLVRP